MIVMEILKLYKNKSICSNSYKGMIVIITDLNVSAIQPVAIPIKG